MRRIVDCYDTLNIAPRVREVITVDIDGLEKVIEISLSPNPSVDEINISFAEARKADIKLYDYLGRLMLSQVAEQAKTSQINVGTFPTGTYFLHVTVEGGSVVKQIVKHKRLYLKKVVDICKKSY